MWHKMLTAHRHGPGLAGPLLGELFDNFEHYFPQLTVDASTYVERPVDAVACVLTHPQYGCVWERDKQAILCMMLHMYQFVCELSSCRDRN